MRAVVSISFSLKTNLVFAIIPILICYGNGIIIFIRQFRFSRSVCFYLYAGDFIIIPLLTRNLIILLVLLILLCLIILLRRLCLRLISA